MGLAILEEVFLGALELLVEYVNEFKSEGIPKAKYQPFLANLIQNLSNVPREEKSQVVVLRCEDFLANH